MRSMILLSWSIDPDETTYAVIADHMINGSVLYKDVIDIKQPGVFLIFALIQIVFGKSMLVIRLITILFISGSAFLLYQTKRRLQLSFSSSLLSAIVFILMFNFYFGFASNAEIFFIFFSSLGIYLFFRSSKSVHYLTTGLVFGVAFIIKQLALFDFAALGIFFFTTSLLTGEFKAQFKNMVWIVVGFLIPFAVVHLVYWRTGYFDYYQFVTYIAPGNYTNDRDWSKTLEFLIKGVVVYLPFFILALLSIWSREWNNRVGWLIGLLLFFATAAIGLTGKAHPHYYLQLAYPVSFAAGMISSLGWVRQAMRKKYARIALYTLGSIYLIYLFYFYHNRYVVREHYTKGLALYAEKMIPEDATLYTGDAPQFLYWYLNKTSPTPYVHSTLMIRDSHIQTLEIDIDVELNRIYSTEPDFILLSEEYRYKWFKEMVSRNYARTGKKGDFVLYKKKLETRSNSN